MGTLWTPEGEHRVPDQGAGSAPPPPSPPPGAGGGDEEGERRQLEELQQELLAAPVEAIVANHCIGLFQLAVLHLNERPPNLEKARLAIDALGAVVDTLGDRLGESAETLRGALSQVRLAFVELSDAEQSSPSSPAADPPGTNGAEG